ncbi:PAX-interacting protein 1 isoform X2 [Petromyzon marinus]|uniref:PAX-interacting protein 1 n=1 Tax=Petromyzon marinus TaxID=7757 RepID=A0AAJ7TDZ7_PETMA|nr:PAX-interacting protein 1-like isoform X2 [Petromyzon marinus]
MDCAIIDCGVSYESIRHSTRPHIRGRSWTAPSPAFLSRLSLPRLALEETRSLTAFSSPAEFLRHPLMAFEGQGAQPSTPDDLFKDVKFYVVGDVDKKVVELLKNNKGKEASCFSLASHVISEDGEHAEVSEAREVFDLPVVKPSWVMLSLRCGVLLPVTGFSPDTGQPFLGVTACLSQIPQEDRAPLWALLTFYGGACQLLLDKRCTHLVIPEPKGEKYTCALKHSRIRVVTPDWVVDCVSSKSRKEETEYHPRLVLLPREEELPLEQPETANDSDHEGDDPNVDDEEKDDEHEEEEEEEKGRSVNFEDSGSAQSKDDSPMSTTDSPSRKFVEERRTEQQAVGDLHRVHIPQRPTNERPVVRALSSKCTPMIERPPFMPPAMLKSSPVLSGPSKSLMIPQPPPGICIPLPGPRAAPSLGTLHTIRPSMDARMRQSLSALPSPSNGRLQLDVMTLPSGEVWVQTVQGRPARPLAANSAMPTSQDGRLQQGFAMSRQMHVSELTAQGLGGMVTRPLGFQGAVGGSGPRPEHTPMSMGGNRPGPGLEFTGISPMVRTLRNITNSAEALQVSRASNVAHVLQSMSVPTRTLETHRPGEPRPPHEGAYIQVKPATSQPSSAVEYCTEAPSDCCLLGCVFAIAEYQEQMLDKQLLNSWKKAIIQNGGLVEAAHSPRCTHLLCESQTGPVFAQALKEGKRCVTAHWLNDTLKSRRVIPPNRALHLPMALQHSAKPCASHIISVTGFVDQDREELKLMIALTGGRYTGYLSRSNTLLVCKDPSGMKFEKAREWRVPCVNITWLCDVLAGNLEALRQPQHVRYTTFSLADPFAPDRQLVANLLVSWKVPIRISKEALLASRNIPKRKLSDGIQSSVKKPRLEEGSLSQRRGPGDATHRVIFTGFELFQVHEYMKKLYFLGGEVAESVHKCTHLVANKVTRTVKFLTAISVVKNIVMPNWLEDSAKQQRFLDEGAYLLRDAEAEVLFSFSLEESMNRARVKPLFQGLFFYLTPGMCPSLATMRSIIECAGGRVLTKQPGLQRLAEHRNNKNLPDIIIISCENDLHLCREYLVRGIEVHNAEFVLTGALTQTLDYESYRFT